MLVLSTENLMLLRRYYPSQESSKSSRVLVEVWEIFGIKSGIIGQLEFHWIYQVCAVCYIFSL
jgi:hypothetical protein